MTSVFNLWGTLGIAVLLGALVGSWWKTRKTRLIVFVATAFLTFIPVLFNAVGVISYLYAFYDVPALSTVFLAPYYWIWYRRPKEIREKDVAHSSTTNRITACFRTALILFGAVLYASEFNLFAFDVYNLGYSSKLALVATCLIILTTDLKISFLISLSYFAYRIGLYANYFDSFLDFGLWTYLTISSSSRFIGALFKKNKSDCKDSSPVPNAEVFVKKSSRKKLTLRS